MKKRGRFSKSFSILFLELIFIISIINFIGVVSAVTETRTFSGTEIYSGSTRPSQLPSCNFPPCSGTNCDGGYYSDSLTAKALCKLEGYDDQLSFTISSPFYTSASDNYMRKSLDGTTFQDVCAQTYNSGIDTVTCTRNTCTPITSCPAMQCGSAVPNGTCSGTLDCSDKCQAGYQCVSETCQPIPITHLCGDSHQVIMKLSQPTNAYGALWNYGTYTYEVCYNESFPSAPVFQGDSHVCSGTNKVINLQSTSNSLGEVPSGTSYTNPVCYGDLMCRAVDSGGNTNSGLVAHYLFDGNTNDASGNGNNGVVIPTDIKSMCRTSTGSIIDGSWFNYGDSDQGRGNSYLGAICKNKLDTFCVSTGFTDEIKTFYSCKTDGSGSFPQNSVNLPLCKKDDGTSFNGRRGFWDQNIAGAPGGNNDFSVICKNNKLTVFCVDAEGSSIGLAPGNYKCDGESGAFDFSSISDPVSSPYCKTRTGADFDGTYYYASGDSHFDFGVVCRNGKLSTICKVQIANSQRGSHPGIYGCGDSAVPDSGGVTVNFVTDPVRGQVASFNGNNYVSVPDSTTLDGMPALTVCLWTKIAAKTNWAYLLSKNNDGFTDGSYGMNLNAESTPGASDQKLVFGVRTASGTGYAFSNDSQDIGVWYHICGRYDGSEISLWQNGVKQTSTGALTGNIKDSTYSLKMGMAETSLNFNGLIDNVKIFNRALSPAEIRYEYDGTGFDDCAVDEKTIVRLASNTDSLISNSGDTNFPIKICCKRSAMGNTLWENMNEQQITHADVGDSVKPIVAGEVSGRTINYTIKKCELVCTATGGVIKLFDKKMAQTSGKGFIVWKTSEEGSFYFIAEILDSSGNVLRRINSFDETNGVLNVGATEDDSLPHTKIEKPVNETNYTLFGALTNAISFEQISSDEDDDLNATWNFADGNITYISNCLAGGNCNITHQYNSSGTKVIGLAMKEITRIPQARDFTRIFVYKPGLNIFAIIDEPSYKMPVSGGESIRIRGDSSHVANCFITQAECNAAALSGRSCYTVSDTVNPSSVLYCYKHALSNELKFDWIIDPGNEAIKQVFENRDNSPLSVAFTESGEHDVLLRVKYVY